MSVNPRPLGVLLIAALACWGAPLLGLLVAGRDAAGFIAFPPRGVPVMHAPFSWAAFALMALPAIGAAALVIGAVAGKPPHPTPSRLAGARFAWWGWLGAGLLGTGWVIAWTDGIVPPAWRRHTFTMLWLGYVLIVNALVHCRSGKSPLTERTRWFLWLFPASAAFWWLFEHLNQFAANWHYAGIERAGDLDYFVQATLPFATVLPAVASTWALVRTVPRLDRMELPALKGHPALPWLALAAGAGALGCLGLRPEELYPMLWIGPLLILLGLQQLLLGSTLLDPLARGDWRPLLQPALAGLVCGLFWEMWNYGSLAKWHYSVPYVQRFHLFEMPLLGYAGYLPFGVACAAVNDLVARALRPPALFPAGEEGPAE